RYDGRNSRVAQRSRDKLYPLVTDEAHRPSSSAPMDRVDPRHVLGLLDRLDVEVDDDRLVVAAHQHAFERLVRARIDLLMRHEGWHIDEIAGPGLGHEFEVLAPAHARLAA